jgi:hypothetical protein
MEKYGFVYLWYDKKHKRYYVGCHWGTVDDGYICSSTWMKSSYLRRPNDFKRRILKTSLSREQMYIEEQYYLDLQKPEEKKIRYYNLNTKNGDPWHKHPLKNASVGQKISYSKKGKSTGPRDPSVGKKISEAKKKAFAERGGMSEEHKQKLREAKLGKKLSPEHREKVIQTLGKTDEWRAAVSTASKKRWEEFRLNKDRQDHINKVAET